MTVRVLAIAIVMSAIVVGGRASGEVSQAEFETLHKELQPTEEPWRTIPWKIDLLNAQAAAAKEGKPIFIWAMDGHPLGCT